MKEKSSTRFENEMRNFLEKFRYLFKGGCETNENEYEDIVLDMLEFAFDENDDINQIRIKGNQLSIYCLSLVQRECKMENPK